MKILITGAYGFVGTNLCQYLAGKGHVCHALDLASARRDGVPYADFFSWDDLAKLPEVDAVVHLAGKAHDLKKVSSPQSYFDVNVGLTPTRSRNARRNGGWMDGRSSWSRR